MASYYDQLKALAESIGSDGCTGVADIYVVCCWEHDWAYVTGMTTRGVATTKEQADQRFRDCIQKHSSFRLLSPMSWIRWLGVKAFGKGIWKKAVTAERHSILHQNVDALREAREARLRIIYEGVSQ